MPNEPMGGDSSARNTRTRRIYVASSWRNEAQPVVVRFLRRLGHEAFDFRQPDPSGQVAGFAWSEIDPDWQAWKWDRYVEALEHPRARQGFGFDRDGMEWADTCVMVLPAGRSSALEAGWFAGAGRDLFIFHPPGQPVSEPELMFKFANAFAGTWTQLARLVNQPAIPAAEVVDAYHGSVTCPNGCTWPECFEPAACKLPHRES